MHLRKGSFGYLPSRTRAGIRWSGLFLFVSLLLLLSYSSTFRYWILPSPHFPSSRPSCPAAPPYPSLVSTPNSRFRWKDVLTRYPVEAFAQLPQRTAKYLPKVQHDFSTEQAPRAPKLEHARRQAAIKATFLRCWTAYKKHAWKQDELLPLSSSSKTTLGGWGLILIDSLSTLWLMDLKDEFNDAVAVVSEIDFAPKDIEINVAKVAKHYLGGLLSAYDLTGCKDARLLHKAMELGDMLYAAFDTPKRMPITRWNPLKAANGEVHEAAENGSLADLTSFSLEFTRLSQLTGDMRYYDAANRITSMLASQQLSTAVPGLWPSSVDIQTANLTRGKIFIPHSGYANLPKTAQLLHSTPAAEQYFEMTRLAIQALLPALLFRPITPSNADILAPTTAQISPTTSLVRTHTMESAFCALGGTLALAARILPDPHLVPYARRVTDACIWAHAAAPHGLMPDSFTLLACASSSPANNAENCTFDPSVWPAQEYPGFETIVDGRFKLGSEAVWSVLVMYRVTGEEKYLDAGWEMWRAIEKATKIREGIGSAVVRDIISSDGRGLENVDEMPSEWMAATLKYFYLLFSEHDAGNLDQWVVSEGGHMFSLW